jgi:hypothetical protein
MGLATQAAAVYATRVVFTGEDPGPGIGGELSCVTRHFTNAQIKALPTSALEALPAPGADQTWHVLAAVVMLDSAGGGYTNIDPAAYLALDGVGTYVGNDAGLGLSDCDLFLGTVGHQLVVLRKEWLTEIWASGSPLPTLGDFQTAGWGVRPNVLLDYTAGADTPVYLVMNNAAAGDLTGGDGSNSLLIRTFAMRVPSPAVWAAAYPI